MKALFLDRDGVVNTDKGYVGHIADFEFIPGVFEALRLAQQHGYLLFVVTNQAGIARGFYTEEDYFRLTHWMLEQFQNEGITVTQVYHCPYHKDGVVPQFTGESDFRKPNPGMIVLASQEHDVTLSQSVLIGDKESDIEAGIRAGLSRMILVSLDDKVMTKADAIIGSIAELPDVMQWQNSK